jgi:hypothetical protein
VHARYNSFDEGRKALKAFRIIGFKEKEEIIQQIDEQAELQGLDRSGYLRQLVREKLRATRKEQ